MKVKVIYEQEVDDCNLCFCKRVREINHGAYMPYCELIEYEPDSQYYVEAINKEDKIKDNCPFILHKNSQLYLNFSKGIKEFNEYKDE